MLSDRQPTARRRRGRRPRGIVAGMIFIAASAAATTPAGAEVTLLQHSRGLDALIANIRVWTHSPVVQIMLRAQNKKYGSLSAAQIDALDKQWVAERKATVQPLIGPAMSNPLSTYLLGLQAQSGGLYAEIFVMDRNGLNVGQSSITSDYWQGDEAKFIETFNVGAEAVHFGDAEPNDDRGTVLQQLNLTIVDPETGQPSGAVTVEVDLRLLEQRQRL